MILIIDNFDSFTWNLVDYVERTGEKTELLRNDVSPEKADLREVKGIILSPGPGKPSDAGYLFEYIKVFEKKVPILGICLGHQAIGQFYGAEVVKAPVPKHGKVSKAEFDSTCPLFASMPSVFNVVRYHSLVIKQIPEPLQCIASAENLIMAVRHKTLPVYGIQFHPEAFLTENGPEIIENWVKLCKKLVVE